ncbi:NAD(P)-binding protein [Thozetella sp. PMI_491]|nr:NAD(P)-binding protein [Thozetella sp. PMI_491]
MGVTFNPQQDIPDLSGKVCLVTGASSGCGEAALAAMAQHNPKVLYLAARSRAKAEAAIERIRASSSAAAGAKIEFLNLDLASFASVRAAAARVNEEVDRLDLIQLNAGVAMIPHSMTSDGYEVQFGTNYMGHALLTQLLMPKLLETAKLPGADVRIVSLSSISHKVFGMSEGIDFSGLKTEMGSRSGPQLYAQATLCKALFAHQLAKKYPQIKSTSVHPGGVKSDLYGGEKNMSFFLKTFLRTLLMINGVMPDEGTKTQLWCSFSNDVKNGKYYEPIGKEAPGKLTLDEGLSKKLWDWTAKELETQASSTWP